MDGTDEEESLTEWHTAHFISSVASAEESDTGIVLLNQPIELNLTVFTKLWNQGLNRVSVITNQQRRYEFARMEPQMS